MHFLCFFKENFLNKYTLFFCTFLFHLIFIFQGLDLTDFGYHCTNQISSVTFPINFESIQPLFFLTDFIGGIWLSIPGSPNVVWAKLGGILLISVIAALVYSILCNYFTRDLVFPVVLISSMYITMHTLFNVISYYIFPAFLITVEIFLINMLFKNQNDPLKTKILAFLIGFITIPIILSRIPLFLNIIIPFFIVAYLLVIKEKIQKHYSPFFSIGLGFAVSTFLFASFYLYMGILFRASESILSVFNDSLLGTSTISQGHTINSLFSSYFLAYQNVFSDMVYVILFLGIFYLLVRLSQKNCLKPYGNLLIYFFSLISVLILFYLTISTKNVDSLSLQILNDTIGIIILMSIYFIWSSHKKNKKITILLIIGLITLLITPLGSNTGLMNSAMGMWLILPLCILCCYQWVNEVYKGDKKPLYTTIIFVLISMMLIAVFFHTTFIYRDNPNRFNLNMAFSYPALKGIYSTSDRVTLLEEALVQIKNNSKPGDEILAVNSIPILYYLTQTRPALGNPWDVQNPLIKIKMDQENLEAESRYPELLIFSKFNARDPYWPDTENIAWESDLPKLDYLKTRYISDLNYTLIWENRAFGIYKRPDLIYSNFFYQPEIRNNSSIRWLSHNATMIVYSNQNYSKNLTFSTKSYHEDRELRIQLNNQPVGREIVKLQDMPVNLPISLKKGKNILELSVSPGCSSPQYNEYKPNDTHCLGISVENISL
jgi:hypothetical protein